MRFQAIKARTHALCVDPGEARPISVTHWAMAAWLGKARRLSNERGRLTHRDRGDAKNILNDLRGAFAELALYFEVLKLEPDSGSEVCEGMRSHLYTPDGGARSYGADLTFIDDDSKLPVGIDVKSFDCAPNKRVFAINWAKHQTLRGGCEAYYCLLVPPFGRKAFVADLVPYGDVSGWRKGPLGPYADPALQLPIERFVGTYAPGAELARLAASTYSQTEMAKAVRVESTVERLRERVPELRDTLGPERDLADLLPFDSM